MSTVATTLQALLRELQKRSPRIKRAAYLESLKFSQVADEKFSVTGYWTIKGGGSYTKIFDAAVVFSYSGTVGIRVAKTPCRFADDIIREILTERGL